VIQDFNRDGNQTDVSALVAAMLEPVAPRRADYDDFYGGELSVPIIYEPF
jgi:hypothetical protein